ncbi:hypothetical protein F3Y22_tig00110387pilonHSYRG00020 [Hibiscus syriacus]|uniref:Uncharacterized protein n=1 Tax=Hibiscus syriacus TaxID=106335 RepID=A0A6A3ASV6_HIBSY|nr:hypothetical protein F3Y22_tig00110387pilonHSYRG00020 [Hibiscus syriacus]
MKIPSVFSVLLRCLVLPAMVRLQGWSMAFIAIDGVALDRSQWCPSWLRRRRGAIGGRVGIAWSLGYHNPRVYYWRALDRWILPDLTAEIEAAGMKMQNLEVLKTSCTEGLTDDPKALKTSKSSRGFLETSCTAGLTDDPKALKTSKAPEGFLETSCTVGLTDDPKALKTSKAPEAFLETSCTEGLTDDPKALKTSKSPEGFLETSCTVGLTDDPTALKTSKSSRRLFGNIMHCRTYMTLRL